MLFHGSAGSSDPPICNSSTDTLSGRAHEGHVPVPRRPVDHHPRLLQLLAHGVDVLHLVGEMPEVPAVRRQPLVPVPVVGQLHRRLRLPLRRHEHQREPPLVVLDPPRSPSAPAARRSASRLQILHPHHGVQIFRLHLVSPFRSNAISSSRPNPPGPRPHEVTAHVAHRGTRGRDRRRPPSPTRRATVPAPRGPPRPAHPRPRPRFHPRRRLHGRRRRHRPGRPRLLRRRHQDRPRRRRPHPLPDAPLALDPLRDVRDQAAREAPGLRRPPVDPPPHRQRQRILRPLLDPRPRVLHPRSRPTSPPSPQQQPGPRRPPSKAPKPPASSPSSATTPRPPTTTTRPCSPPRASRASPASSPA